MIRPYRTGTTNGRPETPAYQWRARTYPWARAALAAAEAVHGQPYPVCQFGHPMTFSNDHVQGWCRTCQAPPQLPGVGGESR